MSDDLLQLMRFYSRRGWRDWKNKAGRLRHAKNRWLANSIVDGSSEVDRVIDGEPDDRRFIPMPKHGYKGFEWGFFLPMIAKGQLNALILLILVNHRARNCVAFRFESSTRGRHGYAHIQLTSRLSKSGLPEKISDDVSFLPRWLPDRYPAFPIRAENRMEMFLAMATAVHGGCGGIDRLIQDILQENIAPFAQRYKNVLDDWMRILDRNRL